MLRTSERITVYMYMLYKSPDLCWSVNTFSTVRGKKKKFMQMFTRTQLMMMIHRRLPLRLFFLRAGVCLYVSY